MSTHILKSRIPEETLCGREAIAVPEVVASGTDPGANACRACLRCLERADRDVKRWAIQDRKALGMAAVKLSVAIRTAHKSEAEIRAALDEALAARRRLGWS